MVRKDTNIVESCSVQVQKKFNESAQEQVTLKVSQEGEVVDPTRENTFICAPQDAHVDAEQLVYQWDFTDVSKGSKVFLNSMRQDKNKLTISENQLRFDREYSIKCEAVGAKARGEASHRFKTVEKASDVKLLVQPGTIGVAETTVFTLTATKQANEDLHCKFFLEIPG